MMEKEKESQISPPPAKKSKLDNVIYEESQESEVDGKIGKTTPPKSSASGETTPAQDCASGETTPAQDCASGETTAQDCASGETTQIQTSASGETTKTELRESVETTETKDAITVKTISSENTTTADDVTPETKCENSTEGEKNDDVTPLSEKDMGITEYVSSHDGFTAIIKQRYSDFIVNEISEEGEVIHLTTRDLPKEEEEEGAEAESSALSASDIEALDKLIADKDVKAHILIQAPSDKELRTKMHKEVKSRYPALNSNTVEEAGQKMLKISKCKSERRERVEWKAGRGSYCRFVLYKENKDTMDAINLITRLAHLKTQLFKYAGTKDKRGKTSQEITAYRVTANKLDAVNARLRNMMMGNYRYVKEPLSLGQLQGNHFKVVLRNVTGNSEQIKAAMTSLESIGFINYYGMQRFGTTSIPTHHVGRELLHANWEEAVDLILKPRSGEDPSMKACRQTWERSHDPRAAIQLVPGHHSIERTLLQALIKHGEGKFSHALQAIPRNTRLMYVHAYQSYIWNTVTSLRLKKLGFKVNIGDLVLPQSFKSDRRGKDEPCKVEPTTVTEKNQSQYTIQDVVLPLPGYDVKYPDGEVGSWYQDLMEKDGLDMNNMKQSNKDFSLPGDFRHLVVKPKHVTWEVTPYDDYTIPLMLGDLDVLFKKPQPEEVKDGKLQALKLEFSLPASCYATMALREILKTDTSAAFQSTLNVT